MSQFDEDGKCPICREIFKDDNSCLHSVTQVNKFLQAKEMFEVVEKYKKRLKCGPSVPSVTKKL